MKRIIEKSLMLACIACFSFGFVSCDSDKNDVLDVLSDKQTENTDNIDQTPPSGLYCKVYDLGTDAKWINIPEVPFETADMIVINSDEEMKQYVEGGYAPIDFEKYTLLLAYGQEPYMNYPGNNVLLSNGENAFTLEITIVYSLCPALNYWRVGYLVEKVENAKYVIELKRPTPPDGGNTSEIQGLYCEIYNLGPDAKWTNIPKIPSETADLIVINSDEEMKQYVEGKYTPIDFEHVTLLLAYGEESYQNEPGDYVLFSSGDNTYTLEITIKYYELPALNHWRVGYLVEKMENAKYVIDLKR